MTQVGFDAMRKAMAILQHGDKSSKEWQEASKFADQFGSSKRLTLTESENEDDPEWIDNEQDDEDEEDEVDGEEGDQEEQDDDEDEVEQVEVVTKPVVRKSKKYFIYLKLCNNSELTCYKMNEHIYLLIILLSLFYPYYREAVDGFSF